MKLYLKFENDGDVNANSRVLVSYWTKTYLYVWYKLFLKNGDVSFFFNIRWSWERQWKIGVDFLFAFGTHSEAQVCGEKITGVDVKILIWFQWFAAKKNCQRRTTRHSLISVNYSHKMSYNSHFPRVIIERLCWNFRDASIRQNKKHLTVITQKN